MQHSIVIEMKQFCHETVAKVNSLTILLARLSSLCRKDEAQGAEGEV